MPPIDASIIAGLRPPTPVQAADPLERYGKSLALQGLLGQQDLQGLQLQTAKQGLQDDAATRAAYITGGGDAAKTRAALASGGNYKALTAFDKAQSEIDEKKSANRKNNSAADKSEFDVKMGNLQHGAALLNEAKDDSSYQAVLRVGALQGVWGKDFLDKMKDVPYSPDLVKQLQAAGLKRSEQLHAEHEAGTLAQTQATAPFTANPVAGGAPVPNMPAQEFLLDKAKKSAPNVSVKTDVKTGESLGAQVGPMMRDSATIAEGAVKQVDAARRVAAAVDSGKIITGPTADGRIVLSQIGQVLGVGGKDDVEKLANTRAALRGLAELTLQGRQQMKGQGAITESEGKLAERAMSGDINLTAPEIKQLAQASERAARFNHAEHMRKLKVMQDNPALSGIAPFYQGPAMPAATPAPAVPGAPSSGAIRGVLTPNQDGSFNYGQPR